MSIYGTWLYFDADHEEGCAKWIPDPEFDDGGIMIDEGNSCTCGQPFLPLVYQGSHILPSADDARGGGLEFAGIPDFITRDGRDDAPEGELKDWIRFSLWEDPTTYRGSTPGSATVVLTRTQVERLHGELGRWLEREPEREDEG